MYEGIKPKIGGYGILGLDIVLVLEHDIIRILPNTIGNAFIPSCFQVTKSENFIEMSKEMENLPVAV